MELWDMKSDYPAKLLLTAAKRTTADWCADAVKMCQTLDRRMKSEKGIDAAGELKLLLVRLGDFYEAFGEDATVASPILGVTLTMRGGRPMCGFPYYSVDTYLAKLIRAGKTVALCDYAEDPATAKGLVRREITRVITPN